MSSFLNKIYKLKSMKLIKQSITCQNQSAIACPRLIFQRFCHLRNLPTKKHLKKLNLSKWLWNLTKMNKKFLSKNSLKSKSTRLDSKSRKS